VAINEYARKVENFEVSESRSYGERHKFVLQSAKNKSSCLRAGRCEMEMKFFNYNLI
jgi:hypothetical protein